MISGSGKVDIVMDYVFTFDHHIKSPEISVEQYIRSKCIDLSRAVNAKKVVYFDTKFWLIVRDIVLGRSRSVLEQEFYKEIMQMSEENRLIFPISQDVLLEVIKQSDPETLNQTVQLIDKLSCGVSLINFEERLELEIKYFLYSSTGKSVYDCRDMAWTKLAYNMGFVTPSNKNIEPETDKVIQKAFIDQMWNMSLSDIINIISENGDISSLNMPGISEKLNEGKFNHEHENNSFKKMFLSELAGSLDGYGDIIAKCMEDMYMAETGKTISEEEKINSESGKWLRYAIYNLFKQNKAKSYFPTFVVISGLHASIRWDKSQKYQDNDLHDIRHAASALPYCDAFFTEKRLAHLITQKATGYDKKYSCAVCSSVSGALGVLQSL
jgi:hypothetical protein